MTPFTVLPITPETTLLKAETEAAAHIPGPAHTPTAVYKPKNDVDTQGDPTVDAVHIPAATGSMAAEKVSPTKSCACEAPGKEKTIKEQRIIDASNSILFLSRTNALIYQYYHATESANRRSA